LSARAQALQLLPHAMMPTRPNAALAAGLDHPRWLHVLPNGDVLVAETNAPERPLREELLGLQGKVMAFVMKRAGAAVPSANRITLLRDADGDGRAETRSVFLDKLNSPFGMALVGDRFYVANTDAVMEFAYQPGQTRVDTPARKVTDLPGGPLNHHWTKSLIASPDGRKLYATVGSNSNVAEHGMQHEEGRAAIWEIDRASGSKRLFASGLRNPNGMAFTPDGMLWTVVNERDELGSDLVPGYLTSVRDGSFYGWPYSYWGRRVHGALTAYAHASALPAGGPPPRYSARGDGRLMLQVSEGLFQALERACRARAAAARVLAPDQAPFGIVEHGTVDAHAVACQLGAERRTARAQHLARALVGVLGQHAALRDAEGVGQEQLGIARIGLEQHDVGVWMALLVAAHAELEARMDQRAEGLRQHHRQPAVHQLRDARLAAAQHLVMRRARGVEGHQRVQADQQVQPLVEQHGGVQRLLQRSVDAGAATHLDRRVQARQCSAGLHRNRDRHVVEAGLAEGHGLARVQVGGDEHELAVELAEIVAAALLRKEACQPALHRLAAEQAGGQRTAQAFDGGQP
jgi:hypothetical protein